jgi:phosphoribosylaminoimidazole carboxylase PurE protein
MAKKQKPTSKSQIQVAIIMGSQSDWRVMREASKTLKAQKVPHEVQIVSAHRTPEFMVGFAKEAQGRGLQVIIAGAGGAAHLPGMVASLTPLPVIGVPIRTGHLDGLDALLSIAQMPRGVPVASMAVDNAANAALLALRILEGAKGDRTRTEKLLSAQRNKVLKLNRKFKKTK